MESIDNSAAAPDGSLTLSVAIDRLCKRAPIMWLFSKNMRDDSLNRFDALLADIISGEVTSSGFNERTKCFDEPIDVRIFEVLLDKSRIYKMIYMAFNNGKLLAGGEYIEGQPYSHVKLIFSKGRRKNRVCPQASSIINKGGAERKPAWAAEEAIAARIIAEYDYSLPRPEFKNKLKNCIYAAGVVDPHEDQQLNKLADAVYEYRHMDVENLER